MAVFFCGTGAVPNPRARKKRRFCSCGVREERTPCAKRCGVAARRSFTLAEGEGNDHLSPAPQKKPPKRGLFFAIFDPVFRLWPVLLRGGNDVIRHSVLGSALTRCLFFFSLIAFGAALDLIAMIVFPARDLAYDLEAVPIKQPIGIVKYLVAESVAVLFIL